MAFTFSCSGDDDGGGDGNPFAGIPGYEYKKERLKYYDPEDAYERCRNGVTERMCEDNGKEVWYNPLTHDCDYSELCSGGSNGMSCKRTYYGFEELKLCGSRIYVSYVSSDPGRCQGGVLQWKCGDVWYNEETHYCDGDYNPTLKAKERCGNKYYEPYEGYIVECQNGVVVGRCGYDENVTWYNIETHYCFYSLDNVNFTYTYTVKPRVLCGGEYLDGDYERCNNGVIENRCGSMMDENANWYNRITQVCDRNTYTVRDKVRCGS
jgi:hypothetical protein